MVTIEKLKEACLCTCSTFNTAESKVVACTLNVPQIPQQVLDPQGGTFSNGSELCRLHVGKAQRWQCAVLFSKGRKPLNHDGQFGQQEIEALAQENEIGCRVSTRTSCVHTIVRHIAGRGTETGV